MRPNTVVWGDRRVGSTLANAYAMEALLNHGTRVVYRRDANWFCAHRREVRPGVKWDIHVRVEKPME